MCTIVLFHRLHPSLPVVVAANRDELYARAAERPQRLEGAGGAVGGIDQAAGGTWLGVRPDGFFAAITNQPVWDPGRAAPADPSRRSRGEIVREVLARGSLDEARRYLESVDARAYNAFNLLYGGPGGVDVAYGRDAAAHPHIAAVPSGIHILPNDVLDAPLPKVARARALAEALASDFSEDEGLDDLAPSLRGMLADHAIGDVPSVADDPLAPDVRRALGALCVHTERYGTRSASLLLLPAAAPPRFAFADGPPCQAAFERVAV